MKTKTLLSLSILLSASTRLFAHGEHGASPDNDSTHMLAHFLTFPLEHPVVSVVTLVCLTGLVVFRKAILHAIRA